MKKILITGGSGLIGSKLKEKLKNNKNLIIFSPSSKELDITKKENVINYNEKYGPFDIVFHFAAILDEKDQNLFNVNVNGTKNICEYLDFEKIVYISSLGVLGEGSNLTPSSKYNPKTKYELSKALAEIEITKNPQNYLIIRCPVIIGPNKYWKKIFNASRIPILFGDGKNIFPLTYYKEIIDFLSNMVEIENREGIHHFVQFQENYEKIYKVLRKVNDLDDFHIKIPLKFAEVICEIIEKINKNTIFKKEHLKRLTSNRKSIINIEYRFKSNDLKKCFFEIKKELNS